jgi:hypothetical protein
MQRFPHPKTGEWRVSNLNTGPHFFDTTDYVSGHFGANGVYEGAKKVRCGFLTYANGVNYAEALSVGR